MPAVLVAPGIAILAPQVGGAALVSKVGGAVLAPKVGGATLVAQPLRDAHITLTPITPPAGVAVVGSAVVGTSTVG